VSLNIELLIKNNENENPEGDLKIFKSFILTPKDGVGTSKPEFTSLHDLSLTTG
jgi:hypothetical protein